MVDTYKIKNSLLLINLSVTHLLWGSTDRPTELSGMMKTFSMCTVQYSSL